MERQTNSTSGIPTYGAEVTPTPETAEEQKASIIKSATELAPKYTSTHKRWERSTVQTRYGRVSGDPALELEWRETERRMDRFLERLHPLLAETVDLEPSHEPVTN
jgi:hypothetical protein